MPAEAEDALFQRGGRPRAAASGAQRTSPVAAPSPTPLAARDPAVAAADAGRPAAPKASPDRPVVPAPRPPVKPRHEDRFIGQRRSDALGAMPGQRRPQRNLESDPEPAPRPRIVDETSILGLARWSRGRVGSRVFTAFFVVVYALILLNLIHSLTKP